MRNRDTIILESIYGLLNEGRAETVAFLTKRGVPEDVIGHLVDDAGLLTPDAPMVYNNMMNKEGFNLDDFITLYKDFVDFRKLGHPKAKNISEFQNFAAFKERVKELVDKKYEKIKDQLKRNFVNVDEELRNKFFETDKSSNKEEAIVLSKWFLDARGNINAEELLKEYKRFLTARQRNIEGSDSLSHFGDYADFLTYVDDKVPDPTKKKGRTLEDIKMENEAFAEQEAIYKDERIAIYNADTIGKSLKYTNGFLGQLYSFCIGYPLNGVRNDGSTGYNNYYLHYRRGGHSFYFVRAKYRSNENKGRQYSPSMADDNHLLVISKKSNGWELTPAPNGTRTCVWDDGIENLDALKEKYKNDPTELSRKLYNASICTRIPELRGKENLFKHIPLSKEETDKIDKFERLAKNVNNPSFITTFNGLSDDDKKEYISSNFPVNNKLFKTFDDALRKMFINNATTNRVELTAMFRRELSPQELKTYAERRQEYLRSNVLGIANL